MFLNILSDVAINNNSQFESSLTKLQLPLVSEKTPQRVLKTHAGIIIRFILIAISYLVTELLKTKTKLRYVRV